MQRVQKRGEPDGHLKKRGIGPAHVLNPILTIFGMRGGTLDVFLKFEFRVDRSPNFGATGGQKSPFPYSTRRLYAITACCCRTSCDESEITQGFIFRVHCTALSSLISLFFFLFPAPPQSDERLEERLTLKYLIKSQRVLVETV